MRPVSSTKTVFLKIILKECRAVHIYKCKRQMLVNIHCFIRQFYNKLRICLKQMRLILKESTYWKIIFLYKRLFLTVDSYTYVKIIALPIIQYSMLFFACNIHCQSDSGHSAIFVRYYIRKCSFSWSWSFVGSQLVIEHIIWHKQNNYIALNLC